MAKATVTAPVMAVGTFTYNGATVIAAHGAPYKHGNKVTNIALVMAHFGFITQEALALAYGGNSVTNMARWFTAPAGNVANPSQRIAPFNVVGVADAATCAKAGITSKGGALVLAQATPIAWLALAENRKALPLLDAAYNSMLATVKAATGTLAATAKGGNVTISVTPTVKAAKTVKPSTKVSPTATNVPTATVTEALALPE